jgi:hypothetical protein
LPTTCLALGKLLPCLWQSFANAVAKPCQWEGKTLPTRRQEKKHCFFGRKKQVPIFVFPRKKESHKYVFMKKKKLLKQLIVNFQHSLPAEVYPRTLVLPTDGGKIITMPD